VVAAEPGDPGLYLFRIATARATGDRTPLGAVAQVDLHVANPDQLVRRLAAASGAVVSVAEGVVRVTVNKQDTLSGDPQPHHLAATFLIDYDEASVASLVDSLQSLFGNTPAIDDLVEFVDGAVITKTYQRNFDLASQVASSAEGDCTEHAVLLAALARAIGLPARVVLGVMLVETPAGIQAFGHAWTEVHDGTRWRIADATRPDAQLADATPRYIPLLPVENEGPGYGLQLAELPALYPERIDQIQTANSTPSGE